jgi:hypothetical protein
VDVPVSVVDDSVAVVEVAVIEVVVTVVVVTEVDAPVVVDTVAVVLVAVPVVLGAVVVLETVGVGRVTLVVGSKTPTKWRCPCASAGGGGDRLRRRLGGEVAEDEAEVVSVVRTHAANSPSSKSTIASFSRPPSSTACTSSRRPLGPAR